MPPLGWMKEIPCGLMKDTLIVLEGVVMTPCAWKPAPVVWPVVQSAQKIGAALTEKAVSANAVAARAVKTFLAMVLRISVCVLLAWWHFCGLCCLAECMPEYFWLGGIR